MKRCPECRRDYYDDTLSFCLADATELVCGLSEDERPTARAFLRRLNRPE
ncbi:MAG: hypothetical protein ABIU09_13375 [Pyrinomonadaceae bacterium]